MTEIRGWMMGGLAALKWYGAYDLTSICADTRREECELDGKCQWINTKTKRPFDMKKCRRVSLILNEITEPKTSYRRLELV